MKLLISGFHIRRFSVVLQNLHFSIMSVISLLLNRSIKRLHLPPITPKTPLPPILPLTPRETSFSSPAEASVSPLRKKLPSIDPFPSLPNINDFSRPITDIVDEKNNTIMIMPKKSPSPSHWAKTIISRIK